MKAGEPYSERPRDTVPRMRIAPQEELAHRFAYHPPNGDGIPELHASARASCHETAKFLADNIPSCRELSLALTKLEEAMMWANAAIARNMNG